MKKISIIVGSTRKGSYNRVVANYLLNQFSDKLSIKITEIDTLPFFSQDLEQDLPAVVTNFIDDISQSDGIVIVTPEYGNMIPGVLKNSLEWLSRDYSKAAVIGKPVAIIGASTGGFGTVRAQNQLLLLLTILKFDVDASLRLPISYVDQKVSQDLILTDDETKQKLDTILQQLLTKTVINNE
jgi:chromate reductase, NAD(P)H dehydrogenase (quinone)